MDTPTNTAGSTHAVYHRHIMYAGYDNNMSYAYAYIPYVLLSRGTPIHTTTVSVPKTTFLSVKLTSTIVERVKLFHYIIFVVPAAAACALLCYCHLINIA